MSDLFSLSVVDTDNCHSTWSARQRQEDGEVELRRMRHCPWWGGGGQGRDCLSE